MIRRREKGEEKKDTSGGIKIFSFLSNFVDMAIFSRGYYYSNILYIIVHTRRIYTTRIHLSAIYSVHGFMATWRLLIELETIR